MCLDIFDVFGFDTGEKLWEYVASASWPTGFCDRSIHSLAAVLWDSGVLLSVFSYAGSDGNVIAVRNRLGRFDL